MPGSIHPPVTRPAGPPREWGGRCWIAGDPVRRGAATTGPPVGAAFRTRPRTCGSTGTVLGMAHLPRLQPGRRAPAGGLAGQRRRGRLLVARATARLAARRRTSSDFLAAGPPPVFIGFGSMAPGPASGSPGRSWTRSAPPGSGRSCSPAGPSCRVEDGRRAPASATCPTSGCSRGWRPSCTTPGQAPPEPRFVPACRRSRSRCWPTSRSGPSASTAWGQDPPRSPSGPTAQRWRIHPTGGGRTTAPRTFAGAVLPGQRRRRRRGSRTARRPAHELTGSFDE